MFIRFRASSLLLCWLAVLLAAGACVAIPPSNEGLPPPPAAPSAAPPTSGPAPMRAATEGGLLVFHRRGEGISAGLYAVDVPAGAALAGSLPARQLTSDGGYWPVASPDGQWIAYVVERAGAAGEPPQRDIRLISRDGQRQLNLTQNAAANPDPAWSPDGSQIAFSSALGGESLGIWIQDVAPILAGQAPAPRKLAEVGSAPLGTRPRWSPDGTQIAYLADKKGDNFTQLYTIRADGTGERQLTAHKSDGNGSGMGAPAWQPDGRWILAPMDFAGNRQLVLLPVDGTTEPIADADLRIVTPDEEYADGPAWEADGRWVAFFAGRNPARIAVMDMQSGEVRRIGPELESIYPVWSSDGSRLAYMAQGPEYNQEIYVINRDGSNPVNVTASPAFEINAAWAPPNGG